MFLRQILCLLCLWSGLTGCSEEETRGFLVVHNRSSQARVIAIDPGTANNPPVENTSSGFLFSITIAAGEVNQVAEVHRGPHTIRDITAGDDHQVFIDGGDYTPLVLE